MSTVGRGRVGLSALPNPFLFNRPPVVVQVKGFGDVSDLMAVATKYGDYNNHPLVKYMKAVMPNTINGAPGDAFVSGVRLAMLAMEYPGKPLADLQTAVGAVAAANAVAVAGTDPSVTVFADDSYAKLLPIAQEMAGAAKTQMVLNLGPLGAKIVACVKGGGKWTSSGCVMPVTRQASLGPTTAPAAAAPAPTSHLGLYLGIGAAVVVAGTVGYMALRK